MTSLLSLFIIDIVAFVVAVVLLTIVCIPILSIVDRNEWHS